RASTSLLIRIAPRSACSASTFCSASIVVKALLHRLFDDPLLVLGGSFVALGDSPVDAPLEPGDRRGYVLEALGAAHHATPANSGRSVPASMMAPSTLAGPSDCWPPWKAGMRPRDFISASRGTPCCKATEIMVQASS